jgi:iron complex outermembrane receptor protein
MLAIPVSYAQSGDAQGANATPAEQLGSLQEVVVTAERRSEKLQDVPIAVDVLSADAAQKLGNGDTLSLPSLVPSLQTSLQVTGMTMYLRGVGTMATPGQENAVATYVDDVYMTGFASNVIGFNNIDHVEVLNGPQGTLFGRNATGGVVRVITKDPSQTPELDVKFGFGNYRTFSTNVYATTGLTPDLAVDFAFFQKQQNAGFGHDLLTNQDIYLGSEYGIRSKVKWTPGDKTSVTLEADHYFNGFDYGVEPSVVPGTLSQGNGAYVGDYNNQIINLFSGGRSENSDHVDGASLTAEHEFSWMTVRNILAARRAYSSFLYDQYLGPLNLGSIQNNPNMEQYTEEVHLRSNEGLHWGDHAVHWQGGIFLIHLNEDLSPLRVTGTTLGDQFQAYNKTYTSSYAGFLDGTIGLNSTTNLTLGGRYTEDRVKERYYTVLTGGFAGNGVFSQSPAAYLETSVGKPTYRAILDHHFTEDFMAYASVSRGFKSGGFSLFSAGTPATLPEVLDAYAIGAKTEWFDHRFQANAEAYYYDYKNQIVSIVVAGGGIDLNAAKSRIYGLDLSFVATPIPDLTLSANFGYLHGRYLSFPGAAEYVQQPATCTPQPMQLPGPLVPGSIQCAIDAAGMPTIFSPTYSGNITADYTVYKGARGSMNLTANYFRTSQYDWNPPGQYPQQPYGLLDSSLTWKTPSDKYELQLWCTNCANTYHNLFVAPGTTGEQRAAAPPREYGLRVGLHL